jgi:hypothetical protein
LQFKVYRKMRGRIAGYTHFSELGSALISQLLGLRKCCFYHRVIPQKTSPNLTKVRTRNNEYNIRKIQI